MSQGCTGLGRLAVEDTGVRFLFGRRRREDDLEQEIRSHLEMAARDGIDRGESPADADAAARREFGNVALVYELQSMEQRLAQSLSSRRMNLMVVGAFAVLALTLAAVGVYGVMAYTVSQRTREIAIRIALGASVSNVLKLVVGQGMALVGAGVMVGLIGAWALTRVIASLLFGVSPTDPVVFVAAPALLSAIALLACYVPARRATPIDPVVVLRCE